MLVGRARLQGPRRLGLGLTRVGSCALKRLGLDAEGICDFEGRGAAELQALSRYLGLVLDLEPVRGSPAPWSVFLGVLGGRPTARICIRLRTGNSTLD